MDELLHGLMRFDNGKSRTGRANRLRISRSNFLQTIDLIVRQGCIA